jgi:hypothetical protein
MTAAEIFESPALHPAKVTPAHSHSPEMVSRGPITIARPHKPNRHVSLPAKAESLFAYQCQEKEKKRYSFHFLKNKSNLKLWNLIINGCVYLNKIIDCHLN